MPLFFLGMLPIVMTGVYAAHQIKCDIEKKKNIKQGTGKPKTVHSSDSVPKYTDKISFYLNSSNRDMQEAITLVSKGDELEIEYDVSKRKFEHLADTTNRSWVAMMAHFGCWEYFGAYQLYDERAQVIGVYHPLRNAAFDQYFYTIRSRFGLLPMPMKDIARFGVRHRDGYEGRPIVYGMIADQRPPQDDKNQTFDFLGCPTSFFMGSEWIARRLGLPAYFMDVRKVGRAKYSCVFNCLYDGKEEVAEGEITRRYVEALDAMIRREPHLYLWSHRRWKHLDIAEDEARRAAKTK